MCQFMHGLVNYCPAACIIAAAGAFIYPRQGMETMRFQRGNSVVVGERVKYCHIYFPFIANPLSLSKQTKELCILSEIL
jgi:hypothetical protein